MTAGYGREMDPIALLENLLIVLISRSKNNKEYKKKAYSCNTCLNETDKVTLSARVGGLDGHYFFFGSSRLQVDAAVGAAFY
jgi:hypothetical protein